MTFTHKTFLCWLVYITAVVFALVGAFLSGLPQLVLTYDHSYLSFLLMGCYVLAEIYGGVQAVAISRESRIVAECRAWLDEYVILKMILRHEGVHLIGEMDVSDKIPLNRHVVPNSPFADHLRALFRRADKYGEERMDQRILLSTLSDRIFDRTSAVTFLASRIVWIGILATIVGVIMAFWPFMAAGMTADTIRQNLTGFFGGVAVAFLPTAVSFVFKIALDINARILSSGAAEAVDGATIATEAHVVPFLEKLDFTQPTSLGAFGSFGPIPEETV